MIRRFLRALGNALLVAGVALMVDAGLTVAWQEPFSAAYAHFVQGGLNGDLDELSAAGPGAGDVAALAALSERDQKIAYLARSIRRQVPKGQPIARISIPKLKLGRAVVDGTDTASLRKGPGLIESTDLPGLGGTTAIAGHRTTYGAPFHSIDRLKKGDRIFVGTPYGRFEYVVNRQRIVKPTDVWVLERIGRERLVLSACHPLYSAAERIIVFAEFVKYRPPSKGKWASVLSAKTGSLAATPQATP
ncbi:MAG: class E sortase [Solirubrobacteraceae bacterium]|nr:class E sortase [Solirubrobacteraceae bacterium]